MTELEQLEIELDEAISKKVKAYGTYMYYECADHGYDAKEASMARRAYYDAKEKVNALKVKIEQLKGETNACCDLH